VSSLAERAVASAAPGVTARTFARPRARRRRFVLGKCQFLLYVDTWGTPGVEGTMAWELRPVIAGTVVAGLLLGLRPATSMALPKRGRLMSSRDSEFAASPRRDADRTCMIWE